MLVSSKQANANFTTASFRTPVKPAEPISVQPPEEVAEPNPVEDSSVENATGERPSEEGSTEGRREDDNETDTEDGDKDEAAQPESIPTPTLELADVVASVRNAYPKIREAIARQDEASGGILAAFGNFDTKLEGETINQPVSFYENYRHQVGVKQPLWNGGSVGVGYRLGRGDFEPWYQERPTNEGGEFKLGVDLPILQGRLIDKRRTELFTAEIRRDQTNPELYLEILMAQGDAAAAYWNWVASGINVQIQEEILELGRQRVEIFQREIEAGKKAEIVALENDQLIASRELKLIEAERKFGQSAVKLSMYLRDLNGSPLLPPPNGVPEEFPSVPADAIDPSALINTAIAQRPETRIFQFDLSSLRVQLEQANNELLPKLNVVMETSQDVGGFTSSKGDKQPAIIEAGFYGEVPLQRRQALGKIDQLLAKQRQIEAKLQFATDQIVTEVQEILVIRETALQAIERAKLNVELVLETLKLQTVAFERGAINLALLNIFEQRVADAQVSLVGGRSRFLHRRFITASRTWARIGRQPLVATANLPATTP